jgi:hypothetical protein
MSRRYLVLGLAVVLALALAVPAFGGPTNPLSNLAASSKTVAAKALKTAKAAKKSAAAASAAAGAAQSTANEAKKKAETAQTAATGAQTTANTALSTANSAKATAAEALANAKSSLKGSEFETSKTSPEPGTDTSTPKLVASECKAGQVVTGGGYSIAGEENKVTVSLQGSAFYGPGWLVDAQAISGTGTPTWSLTATAVCAHP